MTSQELTPPPRFRNFPAAQISISRQVSLQCTLYGASTKAMATSPPALMRKGAGVFLCEYGDVNFI